MGPPPVEMSFTKSIFAQILIATATIIAVVVNFSAKITMKSLWQEKGILLAPHSSYPVSFFNDVSHYLLVGSLAGSMIFVCLLAIRSPKAGTICFAVGIPAGVLVWIFLQLLSSGVPNPIQTIVHPTTGDRLMLVDKSEFANNAWDILTPRKDSWYQWQRIFEGPGKKLDLTNSEDGNFLSNPAMYISPDGRFIFVRRGSLWTDCVDLTDEPATMCSEAPLRRQVAESWYRRSRQIEKLVKAAAINF
ncbi:hypothetical protein MnTg02_00602 [bacterium MnTg02]|nr:hypothetical protein MnTg02_00602 [bacterium MnTg02]